MMNSTPPNASPTPINGQMDDLIRIINTAIVSTRVEGIRDFTSELFALVESPAFKCIMNSVKQFARTQMISEKEAAEAIIQTFRKADRVWGDYLFQEGLDRIKQIKQPKS